MIDFSERDFNLKFISRKLLSTLRVLLNYTTTRKLYTSFPIMKYLLNKAQVKVAKLYK